MRLPLASIVMCRESACGEESLAVPPPLALVFMFVSEAHCLPVGWEASPRNRRPE